MVDGTNLLAYVRDNPAKFTDPMGSQATDSKDKGFFRGVWDHLTAPSEEQKSQQRAFREGRYADVAKSAVTQALVGAFIASNPAAAGTLGAFHLARDVVALPRQAKKAVTTPRNDEAGPAAARAAVTLMQFTFAVLGPKVSGPKPAIGATVETAALAAGEPIG